MPLLSLAPTRRLGTVLAVTGLAAILVGTLTPNPRQAAASAATPLLCIVCGEGGGTDVLLNLLLFTPLAIFPVVSYYAFKSRAIFIKALKSLFVLIHSEVRVLCALDSAVGATIGYFAGNAFVGALAGGLLGVFHYELAMFGLKRTTP